MNNIIDELLFSWSDDFIKISDQLVDRINGRTHGIAVNRANEVIIFRQANPAVLIFNKNGDLLNAWGKRFKGAHGLTLVEEEEDEYLWLTDQYSGEVVKTTLSGKDVLSLKPPDPSIYHDRYFSPTWVAVFEKRFGGNGDIWLADGYGKSLIYRYNEHGEYISKITGEEGKVGNFLCPHGIWIDYRKAEPELYIADRANKRVQVYDLEGIYKRSFGQDFLISPCSFANYDDYLLIPELHARLAVLDIHERLVGYIGENKAVCDIPGWPNLSKELISVEKFNSPHGIAVDKGKNIYVVEWIVGGRIIKFECKL